MSWKYSWKLRRFEHRELEGRGGHRQKQEGVGVRVLGAHGDSSRCFGA